MRHFAQVASNILKSNKIQNTKERKKRLPLEFKALGVASFIMLSK